MKKLVIVLLLAGVVLSLSRCELFYTTVEYNISGDSTSLTIRYNDESGEIVDVAAASPWSHSFELYTEDRPFIAFIRVSNGGMGAVVVQILEDGDSVTSLNIPADTTGDLYSIIE